MRLEIINEVRNIKKIMGLLNEDIELPSQSSDLSKVQNLLDLQDVDVKAEDLLDDTEPICTPPKKLGDHENKMVSEFWNWANMPGNKNDLKNIFKIVKDILYDDENMDEEITIGNLHLSSNDIKNIGDTLLVVCVIGLIQKTSNCNKEG